MSHLLTLGYVASMADSSLFIRRVVDDILQVVARCLILIL